MPRELRLLNVGTTKAEPAVPPGPTLETLVAKDEPKPVVASTPAPNTVPAAPPLSALVEGIR